ncbi:hypothetical protein [uncultured Microbacterium sp.]|uniref:hypothetical protein n=1 Tax=uncultured Microbacterium sp. TaxID=191216 RepID=UPI0028D4C1A7|nr:hypothetical protein [uncultured Microbacterium sp.]
MCDDGGWCIDHANALTEARRHARSHGEKGIDIVDAVPTPRGPRPDAARDRRIREMRADGATIRTIAAAFGISIAGVTKSLRRTA